jgi:DNA-binding XRE family transcriptional regulator
MRVDGEALKLRRLEMLIERRELAEALDISYTTIYKMEAHDHLPRLSTLKAVCKALKIKPREILIRDGAREEVGALAS